MAEKEDFIRVGTALYKIVNQPRMDGGCVKKTYRMERRNFAAGLRQADNGDRTEV